MNTPPTTARERLEALANEAAELGLLEITISQEDAELILLALLQQGEAPVGWREKLSRLMARASKGPWEWDTEENEGSYGSGPDAREGFKSAYLTDADGKRMFDAINSDVGCVHEEIDGDENGTFLNAWDDVSYANAELIVFLQNHAEALLSTAPQPEGGEDHRASRDHARAIGSALDKQDLVLIGGVLDEAAFRLGYQKDSLGDLEMQEARDLIRRALSSAEQVEGKAPGTTLNPSAVPGGEGITTLGSDNVIRRHVSGMNPNPQPEGEGGVGEAQ